MFRKEDRLSIFGSPTKKRRLRQRLRNCLKGALSLQNMSAFCMYS